jgi:hypothetical protein
MSLTDAVGTLSVRSSFTHHKLLSPRIWRPIPSSSYERRIGVDELPDKYYVDRTSSPRRKGQ